MIIPVQQLKRVFDKCPDLKQNKTVERCCFNFLLIEAMKQKRILKWKSSGICALPIEVYSSPSRNMMICEICNLYSELLQVCMTGIYKYKSVFIWR